MKYLSDYMNDKQTEAFNRYGAFFAFSTRQFDEKASKKIRYASMGQGLIAPAQFCDQLMMDLDKIYLDSIAQDIKDNGIKGIIHRELANHECQITMDYSEVVDKLRDYDITEAQVANEWPEYWNACIENDYF